MIVKKKKKESTNIFTSAYEKYSSHKNNLEKCSCHSNKLFAYFRWCFITEAAYS